MSTILSSIDNTLKTIHRKCSGAAKSKAAKMAVGSVLSEGALKIDEQADVLKLAHESAIEANAVFNADVKANPAASNSFATSATSALWEAYDSYNKLGQEIFDLATARGTKAAEAASFYNAFMYSQDLPKEVALARIAVWSALKDVHDAAGVLTDGQITTVIDAAPLIVGRRGLRELASVSNDEEMSAFIATNGERYGEAIMASAQTWSLFHSGCKRGWPNHLFMGSEIDDEGAALVGLVSYHLQQGDLANPELDANEMISSLVAKARGITQLAADGKPMASPTSEEDIAATFIHLVREGEFGVLDDSGLAAELPDGKLTADLKKEYGLAKHAATKDVSVDVIEVLDRELEETIISDLEVSPGASNESVDAHTDGDVVGGDGGFLGYKSISALKKQFGIVSLASAAENGTSVYKGHPNTHYTYCKFRSWARFAAEGNSSYDADDIYSAALKGKHLFMHRYFSPVVSKGVNFDDGVESRDYVGEFLPPKPAHASALFPHSIVMVTEDSITIDSGEPPLTDDIQQYSSSRFAAANQFSKKYVLEMLGMSMVKNPETALFKFMKTEFEALVDSGISYEDALDTVKDSTIQSFKEEVLQEVPADADESALAKAGKKIADRTTEVRIFSQYLGGSAFESLDSKLREDSMTERYNSMSIEDLEEHSAAVAREWVDGEEVPETFVQMSSIGRDAGDPTTIDRVAGWFRQIHQVLKDNKYDELAESIHALSKLTLPTTEERETIENVLRLRSSDPKTGERLAAIYNTSVTAIHKALVAETQQTEDMFTGGLRRVVQNSPTVSPLRIENTSVRMANVLAASAKVTRPELASTALEGL